MTMVGNSQQNHDMAGIATIKMPFNKALIYSLKENYSKFYLYSRYSTVCNFLPPKLILSYSAAITPPKDSGIF